MGKDDAIRLAFSLYAQAVRNGNYERAAYILMHLDEVARELYDKYSLVRKGDNNNGVLVHYTLNKDTKQAYIPLYAVNHRLHASFTYQLDRLKGTSMQYAVIRELAYLPAMLMDDDRRLSLPELWKNILYDISEVAEQIDPKLKIPSVRYAIGNIYTLNVTPIKLRRSVLDAFLNPDEAVHKPLLKNYYARLTRLTETKIANYIDKAFGARPRTSYDVLSAKDYLNDDRTATFFFTVYYRKYSRGDALPMPQIQLLVRIQLGPQAKLTFTRNRAYTTAILLENARGFLQSLPAGTVAVSPMGLMAAMNKVVGG